MTERGFRVRQAPEAVDGRAYTVLTLATVVIIVFCLGVVVLFERGEPASKSSLVPDDAHVPFAGETPGEALRAKQAERLSSYGWVDRNAGISHIPITDAMQLVADEAAAQRKARTSEPAPQRGR